MRRVLAFLLGIAAGLALVELLSRRRRRPEGPPRDPRAEELARKLAETRGPAAPGPESPPGEPEAGSALEAEIDAARRRVHDEGRAAVDAMRKSGGAPPPAP